MRRFGIEEVFDVRDKVVVTGRMVEGNVVVGDLILLPDGNHLTVEKIEMFRKTFATGTEGFNIGVVLGAGSNVPSKEYVSSFRKEEVEVVSVSEFRGNKFDQLGI